MDLWVRWETTGSFGPIVHGQGFSNVTDSDILKVQLHWERQNPRVKNVTWCCENLRIRTKEDQ